MCIYIYIYLENFCNFLGKYTELLDVKLSLLDYIQMFYVMSYHIVNTVEVQGFSCFYLK